MMPQVPLVVRPETMDPEGTPSICAAGQSHNRLSTLASDLTPRGREGHPPV